MSADPAPAQVRNLACVPWLLAFTALWAGIEGLGYSVVAHYHFLQIVGMRYAVHVLALLAVCALFGFRDVFVTQHPWLQIARGVCMFIMPMSFIVAVTTLSGRDLWALFWIMPIYLAVIAHWLLGERVSPTRWLLLTCGYAAALLMLRPDSRIVSTAMIWPLMGGLSFAGYVGLSRWLRDEKVVTSLFYTGITALLCTLPFLLSVWRPIEPGDVLTIAGIGVCGLLALLCIDRALEFAPASFVAPFLYGAVGWEVMLEVLYTRRLPPWQVGGGGILLLVVATIMIAGAMRRRARD